MTSIRIDSSVLEDLQERVAEAADVQGGGFYIEVGWDELDRCDFCGHRGGLHGCDANNAGVVDALDVELDRIVADRRVAEVVAEVAARTGAQVAADKQLRHRMRGRRS
jgi:hypothetical protein